MSIPTTREEFKDYCLRALGAPVLQVNVDDTQVEDRIDKAFYMFQQFHMDAVVKTYLKHELLPSILRFTGTPTVPFQNGETFVGQTSQAMGTVVKPGVVPGANAIYMVSSGSPAPVYQPMASSAQALDAKPFVDGEVIIGNASNAHATIGTSNSSYTAITLGDYDLKWITVPASVIAITKVFQPYDGLIASDILFDPQAQFSMSLMMNFTNDSLVPYVIGRQYQQLLSDTFRGRPAVRFTRHQQRLYVDLNWFTNFIPHQFLVIECYRTIDPADSPSIWSDRWLQDYTIALLKKQWATNLSKFTGIQLPGGVTLDGKTMMEDAKEELKALEDELKSTFQLPIDFMIG